MSQTNYAPNPNYAPQNEQQEYKSDEIVKFYRDGNMIFAVEDWMNNKLDKKKYKIALKLVPLTKENKRIEEDIMTHCLDVADAKRLAFHLLYRSNPKGLYNKTEKIGQNEYPCWKDMKGGTNGSSEVESRILTFFENKGEYLFQITYHPGRKMPQGAVVPTGGPKKKKFIKLNQEEVETFALELLDYIKIKETMQFKQFHKA